MVIAGEASAARLSKSYNATDPWAAGSLAAKFRESFKFGRKTTKKCLWNVNRMPNPDHSCFGNDAAGETNSLKHVFIDHVYKGRSNAWALTAAISGAHTVGKTNLANSGFDGFWASRKMAGSFDNDFYKSVVMDGWGP